MTEPGSHNPVLGATYANLDMQNLARAIARVVEDYRAEHDPDATLDEVIASTRAELDHDDIDVLTDPAHGQPIMSMEVAAAYRKVLDAPKDALTPAVTSHAEGVLDGTFDYDSCPSDWYGEPSSSDEDQGDPAEIEVLGTEDDAAHRELDARREPLELVEVAESCNAALACASATAAATEAAARARAAGDEDAVALVIVEDVEAACDEDGGF